MRSAKILEIKLTEDAAKILGGRCRGTPRVANRILRRCRDVAQVRGSGVIDLEAATKTLQMLGIDDQGLDPMDRKILSLMIDYRFRQRILFGNRCHTQNSSSFHSQGLLADIDPRSYTMFLVQVYILQVNIGTRCREKFRGLRLGDLTEEFRDSDGCQNTHNNDDNHDLDE